MMYTLSPRGIFRERGGHGWSEGRYAELCKSIQIAVISCSPLLAEDNVTFCPTPVRDSCHDRRAQNIPVKKDSFITQEKQRKEKLFWELFCLGQIATLFELGNLSVKIQEPVV